MDKNQIWDSVLSRLSEKISRMEFHTWFKKVRLKEISGDAALISCPTEMNKNWLETKYKGILLTNIRAVVPAVERLFFQVDLALADSQPSNPAIFDGKKEAAHKPQKVRNEPRVRLAEGVESRIIQSKFTLGNYVVGEANRLAHAACSAVSERGAKAKQYNPLFIYGGVGLGKTHLLQGTANEILRKDPDAVVVYTTSERFTNEIVKAIRDRKTDAFRKKYRRVDALIIDDVQFFEGKEQTQNELFNTFNDLFDFGKQIIFSADRPPSELTGISDRLKSRMGWGLTVDVQLPGYETRLAIIQKKATDMQLVLGPDVEEFIAANVRRSLRELESILKKVGAEWDLSSTPPTVQSVGKIFRKLNPTDSIASTDAAGRGLAKSPEDIITFVAEYFQVPATEILGTSRKQTFVYPRQICWLLCKDVLRMSYEAIGAAFGGKNHTTIMHGLKKIKALVSQPNDPTKGHLSAIRHDLGLK